MKTKILRTKILGIWTNGDNNENDVARLEKCFRAIIERKEFTMANCVYTLKAHEREVLWLRNLKLVI